MGYAVPAAMGAKFGMPDKVVWAIDGDGCFQMTNQELATCAIEGRADQGRRDQQRQPRHGPAVAEPLLLGALLADRPRHAQAPHPDFTLLAEALGCAGLRCESREDVDAGDQQGDGDQRPAGG